MELSRRAAFSPERLNKLTVIERLQLEEQTVGSSIAYLRSLGVYYEAVPDHRANMLQLQRVARLVADPQSKGDDPATDAFYWGEILGYTLCDRMIGEQWSDLSYRMVNANIPKLANDYEIEDLSTGENRQTFSDLLMGALEQLDGESFPPMVDDYIQEKVASLSDDPRIQHYIVMGFRHIVRQVAETASEEVIVANEFFNMMDRNEVEDLKPAFEAIDDVREYLMDRFADHVMEYGKFDEDDDDALDAVTDHLSAKLNRDLLEMESLNFDDDVFASGDVMYITADHTTGELKVVILPEGLYLKGTVRGMAVLEVPTNEMIPTLRAIAEDPSIEAGDIQTNQLGVTLLLADAQISNDKEVLEVLSPRRQVCLVLNNPAVQLAVYRVGSSE